MTTRPPTQSRPPMPSDEDLLKEVDQLVSGGQVDEARQVLDDALRSRPSGAEVVRKRRELDRPWEASPPKPHNSNKAAPAQPSGGKSGVVARTKTSTGFKDWPSAAAKARASRPQIIIANDPNATPVAAPAPAVKPPRSTGLKLWPSPPKDPELTRSDRPTIPPELPNIDIEPVSGLVVAGKYRIERVLKQGGMGSVWVATHLDLDRPVAIKFMSKAALERTTTLARRGSDPTTPSSAGDPVELTRARFEREARAAARIRSVNVVQVYDHGVDRGLPYIVMELLEGEDLGSRLDKKGRLTLRELATLLPPIAHALQRAHDANVVHRDLKPENIFLARDGDVEVLKILDFGVSKVIQGGDQKIGVGTLEGALVGTPFYMSPEQAVGRTDVDHRSDLWSLGVILFRALTGQRPFGSTALLESVVEIASAPIPKASSVFAELGPEVDAFFDRALARAPAERFQSAKEMARAFAELCPTSIRPKASLRPDLAEPSAVALPAGGLFDDDAPAPAGWRRWSLGAIAARRGWTLPPLLASSPDWALPAAGAALAVLGLVLVIALASGGGEPKPVTSAEAQPTVAAQPPAPPPSSAPSEAPSAGSAEVEPPSGVPSTAAAASTAAAVRPKGPSTAAPAGGGKKKGKRDVGY